MATVTGLTAERMIQIENASVVDGDIVGDNLILVKYDGTQINAGNVRGPQGIQGPTGEVEEAPVNGTAYVRKDGLWTPGPTSADLAALPQGELASVYSNAGQNLGTGTAEETLTSLTLSNVVIPAGRKIKTSLHGGFGISGTGPVDLLMHIYRDAVKLTYLKLLSVPTNGLGTVSGFAFETPAAGTYVYTVTMSQTSSGPTKRSRGDSAAISFVIEDLGAA